ncbi:hypothetical protein DFR55_10885 [Herbinix hemicellulosilytica]|uniref:Uncharacterized protein n=1 Tax=Herbinix hemicellulosilytica TaxID=1564487 RepID=A0A0H5SFY3_HERHM|nr:hypothetical protein DFR55_10885 [Herbinix hemicellulosilytica]CRZ33950.1 hypothetical protein HHT355_0747 [Herbinix hemicellulosilytica]
MIIYKMDCIAWGKISSAHYFRKMKQIPIFLLEEKEPIKYCIDFLSYLIYNRKKLVIIILFKMK